MAAPEKRFLLAVVAAQMLALPQVVIPGASS
jgi:hypothetical protein